MTSVEAWRSEAARKEVIDGKSSVKAEDKDRYRAEVKSLGAMIRTNGLRAVLLECEHTGSMLANWFRNESCPLAANVDERWDLLTSGMPSRPIYRQATEEALAYAQWAKRWLNALDPGTKNK
jgi:CRISPR/Cas system CMR-associated protein Cmr5 small subunit